MKAAFWMIAWSMLFATFITGSNWFAPRPPMPPPVSAPPVVVEIEQLPPQGPPAYMIVVPQDRGEKLPWVWKLRTSQNNPCYPVGCSTGPTFSTLAAAQNYVDVVWRRQMVIRKNGQGQDVLVLDDTPVTITGGYLTRDTKVFIGPQVWYITRFGGTTAPGDENYYCVQAGSPPYPETLLPEKAFTSVP